MKRKYTYEINALYYLHDNVEVKADSRPDYLKQSTITISSDAEIDRENIINYLESESEEWPRILERFVESIFDFLKDSHDNLQVVGVDWNNAGKYTYTLSQNYKEDKF